MQPARSVPYCLGQPRSDTHRPIEPLFPRQIPPLAPQATSPLQKELDPQNQPQAQQTERGCLHKDKFGAVPHEPQSCRSAFFLPQLPPCLLLGPSLQPKLLTGVIPEMRWVDAQLSRQQGPLHVPAQMSNPQHGVEKQKHLQASFSLCRSGSV